MRFYTDVCLECVRVCVSAVILTPEKKSNAIRLEISC
jgi:hypothetical protein